MEVVFCTPGSLKRAGTKESMKTSYFTPPILPLWSQINQNFTSTNSVEVYRVLVSDARYFNRLDSVKTPIQTIQNSKY